MSGGPAAAKPFRNWVRRAAIRVIRRPAAPTLPWTIGRGDLVQVLSGRSAGKQGKVKSVLRRKNRIIVEGLNLVRTVAHRHFARPSASARQRERNAHAHLRQRP